MEFPKESLDLAKYIASQYNIRRSTSQSKTNMLYSGAFLHLGYGFDDALKTGHPVSFLHEMKRKADCDSYAGALYLIAKELKLKPKIYSAYGMKDVGLGEDIANIHSANHTFITVEVNQATYVVDPFYSVLGKAKIDGNHIKIIEHDGVHNDQLDRICNMLVELPEEKYLKRFYRTREGGGREALTIGRVITSARKRVTLEYLPESEELASCISINIQGPLIEKGYSQHTTHCLRGKVSPEGKWDIDNGYMQFMMSSVTGWTLKQFENVHSKIEVPYSIVKEYEENLRTAMKHEGRKSPAEGLLTHNLLKYFVERGFTSIGDISRYNGVDAARHRKLNDELIKRFPAQEPAHIMPFIHQSAVFNNRREESWTDKNKFQNLYSEAEHKKFVDEYIRLSKEYVYKRSDILISTIIAKSGLIPDAKGHSEDLQKHINAESVQLKFKERLLNRKEDIDSFDRSVDFALFQIEHPAGTITATPQQIENQYRREMFQDMIVATLTQKAIEVRKDIKGLERLLKK